MGFFVTAVSPPRIIQKLVPEVGTSITNSLKHKTLHSQAKRLMWRPEGWRACAAVAKCLREPPRDNVEGRPRTPEIEL